MPAIYESIEQVEQGLKSLTGLPAPVRSWKVEIGEDATGENAVWVWAVLDDADLTREVRNQISERIEGAVYRLVPNASFVYVRFRAVSEV